MQQSQSITTGLQFDASFCRQLKPYYVEVRGDPLSQPKIMAFNHNLAQVLGLNCDNLNTDELAQLLSGSIPAQGSIPIAQVYAGHQFAHYNPQLGDGRALLLGEILDTNGMRRDIHLKGTGATAFSRGGDGKAAIGPVLREYLMGEAMHALNIPTTRGLAAILTGEKIFRDGYVDGAVIARVASSHIRVGTFQYYAAQQQPAQVKLLADYCINRHFPELLNTDNPYLGLLKTVCDRQAQLIAQWDLVGFVHGVMNTDNMAISGETIDYGPCAFIDQYDANACFSSIDRKGRYALGKQASIGQWNMARLAETLLPFIHPDSHLAIEMASEVINNFISIYQHYWLQKITAKLGLSQVQQDDLALAQELLATLQGQQVDFTQFFRSLADAVTGNTQFTCSLFAQADNFMAWYTQWQQRLNQQNQPIATTIKCIKNHNPIYIPRNHLVEHALQAAATEHDLKPFEQLLTVLSQPYTEVSGLEKYAQPAGTEFAPYVTFCGT